MKLRAPTACFVCLLTVFCTVFFGGCGRETPVPRQATHFYVYVDQSASPAAKHLPRWEKAATAITGRLRVGDAITVFPLHDRTGDAAALVEGSTAILGPNAGVDAKRREVGKLAVLREKATAAVRESFASGHRAKWTDIFSAWDRVQLDRDGRRNVLVLLTDAMHSTPDLDFERHRIPPDQFATIIERAAASHRWSPDTLKGADVNFVLSGADSGDAAPKMDRRTLREFYAAMVTALGGRLTTFDVAPEGRIK